jgi:hypothetical protein
MVRWATAGLEMDAKQLIIGLSILIPVFSYAKPHSPFAQETIKIPSHLCQYTTIDPGYIKTISVDMSICYVFEYWQDPGLVFVQVDTLQGSIFGFGGTTLYDYQNRSVEAYQNLIKNLNGQHRSFLGIGRYRTVPKYPIKLNNKSGSRCIPA